MSERADPVRDLGLRCYRVHAPVRPQTPFPACGRGLGVRESLVHPGVLIATLRASPSTRTNSPRLIELHKTRLKQTVVRRLHAERRIRCLRARIFLFDIKPKPDHARARPRPPVDLAIHRAEHAAAAC